MQAIDSTNFLSEAFSFFTEYYNTSQLIDNIVIKGPRTEGQKKSCSNNRKTKRQKRLSNKKEAEKEK
jgi:hypothetical protein